MPIAGWFLWRRRCWHDEPEARFGCVWLVSLILLLSLLEYKRSDYLLPAYPGAALMLGCVAERWCRTLTAWHRRLAFGSLAAIVLAAALTYVAVGGGGRSTFTTSDRLSVRSRALPTRSAVGQRRGPLRLRSPEVSRTSRIVGSPPRFGLFG